MRKNSINVGSTSRCERTPSALVCGDIRKGKGWKWSWFSSEVTYLGANLIHSERSNVRERKSKILGYVRRTNRLPRDWTITLPGQYQRSTRDFPARSLLWKSWRKVWERKVRKRERETLQFCGPLASDMKTVVKVPRSLRTLCAGRARVELREELIKLCGVHHSGTSVMLLPSIRRPWRA